MPADPLPSDADITKVQRTFLAPPGLNLELPLVTGELVQGRYELVRYLGAGGVGIVVAARHRGFDETVALKFLRPSFCGDAGAVSRFSFEARASFRLRSEHVARVLDVDSHQGVPFMAMELLEGVSLRELQQSGLSFTPQLAVDYMLQLCEALSAAHGIGLIHRDIKPENLFVIGEPEHAHIRVLDFGISKVVLDGALQLPTESGPNQMAVGTPPYMAPEQIRGAAELDARADLFAVGCVLYELLAGKPPFERQSITGSCAAVLEDEPAPLRTLRPDVPEALCQVISRCLRKQPQHRWPDCAALAQALAAFGSRRYRAYPERCRAHLTNVAADAETDFSAAPATPLRRALTLHLTWFIPVLISVVLAICWFAKPEPQPTLFEVRPLSAAAADNNPAPAPQLLLPGPEEPELPAGQVYEDIPRAKRRRALTAEVEPRREPGPGNPVALEQEPDVGF